MYNKRSIYNLSTANSIALSTTYCGVGQLYLNQDTLVFQKYVKIILDLNYFMLCNFNIRMPKVNRVLRYTVKPNFAFDLYLMINLYSTNDVSHKNMLYELDIITVEFKRLLI